MKNLLLPFIAALGISGAAHAASYSVDVTANPFNQANLPGLNTRAFVLSPSGPQNYTGSTISFDLSNVGDTTGPIDLYGLVTFETAVDSDDLIPQTSTATFDFGFASRTIQGTTKAVLGSPDYALAQFVDSAINIGGGLRILITLADTVFGTDGVSFVQGRPGIGFVNATFTLAEVPLPATLPLGLSAIGLMAFVARRRRVAEDA